MVMLPMAKSNNAANGFVYFHKPTFIICHYVTLWCIFMKVVGYVGCLKACGDKFGQGKVE